MPWAALAAAAVAIAGCGGGTGDGRDVLQARGDEEAQAFEPLIDRGGNETAAVTDAELARPASASGAPRERTRAAASAGEATPVPAGPANAHERGHFGPAFAWPIVPIHTVLLPDGRVLSYGSTDQGVQTGLLHYAVWDPALGTGAGAMLTLPNTTGTDVFCAGQALLPRSGDVLVVGGDRDDNGMRNSGRRDVNVFDGGTNTLARQGASMAYARWYATVVATAGGELAVIGGRDNARFEGDGQSPPIEPLFSTTPEVYAPATGWRTLSKARSVDAFGNDGANNWSYPRAWWSPSGRVVTITPTGKLFSSDVRGEGSTVQLPGAVPDGGERRPAVMYRPGKILTVRGSAAVSLVDLNGATPVISATRAMSVDRQYGNATVLADGRVWASGGSSTGNDLAGAAYHGELWDPATGRWTRTAEAAKARLYHSTAMLLPDGSVLTGGGGAPGPITQLNAELYYPPYLYRQDGSGRPAARPVIVSAPTSATWGQTVSLTVSEGSDIARATLVRFGAVTHAFNNDQRFQNLTVTQRRATLDVTLPSDRNLAPPGFYMLFVLDGAGVPSKAAVLRLGN